MAEVLRPPAVRRRSQLAHQFLENLLGRSMEVTVAAELQRMPDQSRMMAEILEELERDFLVVYDPVEFISAIPALRSLEPTVRRRLQERLHDEFQSRFRPEERLEVLRAQGRKFLDALHAWQSTVQEAGVGTSSALPWRTLRERSAELLEVLRDPELRTRWIP